MWARDVLAPLMNASTFHEVHEALRCRGPGRRLGPHPLRVRPGRRQRRRLQQQRLRLKQELLTVKQQMLSISTTLEQKLQLIRDQEYQLADCTIKLREAQSIASLNEAKLEGKLDVNTTKVEAKDREIAYLQESIKEKDERRYAERGEA